jgi:hypothetical protein
MDKKLKSATIVETIVALLILMISFSAGMVIYNRILSTGINDLKMNAELTAGVIADSLHRAGTFNDQRIQKEGVVYEVAFVNDQRYPELKVLKVICTDENNKPLAVYSRLINSNEKGQD